MTEKMYRRQKIYFTEIKAGYTCRPMEGIFVKIMMG